MTKKECAERAAAQSIQNGSACSPCSAQHPGLLRACWCMSGASCTQCSPAGKERWGEMRMRVQTHEGGSQMWLGCKAGTPVAASTTTYQVLHLAGNVQRRICCAASRAPGDVTEHGAVCHHALHPLPQRIHALKRTVHLQTEISSPAPPILLGNCFIHSCCSCTTTLPHTSSVLGGKNSKEKKFWPFLVCWLIRSMIFMFIYVCIYLFPCECVNSYNLCLPGGFLPVKCACI